MLRGLREPRETGHKTENETKNVSLPPPETELGNQSEIDLTTQFISSGGRDAQVPHKRVCFPPLPLGGVQGLRAGRAP